MSDELSLTADSLRRSGAPKAVAIIVSKTNHAAVLDIFNLLRPARSPRQ